MKKLSIISIMLLMCLIMSSVVLAADVKVKKCVYPAGAPFVVIDHSTGNMVLGALGPETTITILEELENLYRFSASYDSVEIYCPIHGVESYEMYSKTIPQRLMNSFYVAKQDAISCE